MSDYLPTTPVAPDPEEKKGWFRRLFGSSDVEEFQKEQTASELENPGFFKRLFGRGDYMKQVQKIRYQEKQRYLQEKRRLMNEVRRQRYYTKRDLEKVEKNMYGRKGYHVDYYQERAEI